MFLSQIDNLIIIYKAAANSSKVVLFVSKTKLCIEFIKVTFENPIWHCKQMTFNLQPRAPSNIAGLNKNEVKCENGIDHRKMSEDWNWGVKLSWKIDLPLDHVDKLLKWVWQLNVHEEISKGTVFHNSDDGAQVVRLMRWGDELIITHSWFRRVEVRILQSLYSSSDMFFSSMTAAFSDSHPTLHVVHGSAKTVLRGTNSTEPNMFHHGETTYRVGWLSKNAAGML